MSATHVVTPVATPCSTLAWLHTRCICQLQPTILCTEKRLRAGLGFRMRADGLGSRVSGLGSSHTRGSRV
eukprot:2529967-Rhodomonas_salina.2